MPSNPPRCRHLHTDGRQCGSPAVRHEKLCYQHLAATKRPSYTPTLPDPEDLHAVQRGLAELLRLVARELVEDKQAKRLFLILTAAGTNLARLARQQAQARELDLRERALTLAEARLQAQHTARNLSFRSEAKESASPASEAQHPAQEPGCPTSATVPPRLTWASSQPEAPVTDPVDDPELGALAPGPDPEPRPAGCSTPEKTVPPTEPAPSAPETDPAHPEPDAAGPARPLLAYFDYDPWPSPAPKAEPEIRSAARQRELDAEAAEQIEFDRRENAWKEENNRIRHDNYTIRYNLMVPSAQLEEDRRRVQLQARYHGSDVPLGPHPRWGITEQPF